MVKYEYHINIHRITCNYFAIKVPSISSSANLTILSSLWTHRSTILLFLLPNKPLYQTQTERYINSILTLHRYKHYPCWAQSKPQSTQSIPLLFWLQPYTINSSSFLAPGRLEVAGWLLIFERNSLHSTLYMISCSLITIEMGLVYCYIDKPKCHFGEIDSEPVEMHKTQFICG